MSSKTTPVAYGSDNEKITVYFSLEEGWIHILHFKWTPDSDLSSHPARSEVMPYSESQMRYLRARAEESNNIYIFQAKRDNP